MINIQPFKAILPKTALITSPDSFFGQVKEQYATLLKAGYFEQSDVDALYIYEITTQHRTHVGLLAGLDVVDYIENRVRKHEQTITYKEERTVKLLEERTAMIKPVLLAHRHIKGLEVCLTQYIATQKCLYSIQFKGIKHSIWQVTNPTVITQIQQFYNQENQDLYIADGHHRMAGAQRLYEKNNKNRYILTAIFADTELNIWDYNRVVEGIGENTPIGFIAKLSTLCILEPVAKATKPRHKHEFAVCIEGEWLLAAWRKEVLAEYAKLKNILDVSILDEKVLKNLLGITDIRTDFRVSYWEGVKGLDVLDVRGRTPSVGFALFPADITDLMQIAEADGTMPPKSTWFEPRIKNGFIGMKL
jgi:uncharacterized protein (DUF1015 family)